MAIRDDFEALAQEFFDIWYRLNPVEASWLGIHAYDDQLGDASAEGAQERIGVLRDYTDRFASIPPDELPPELAVDYQVVAARLRSELWSLGKVADWQRNPASYVQEPLFGLLLLTTREYAPVEQRAASALGRLERLGDLLDAGRINVTNQPAVFVDAAIHAARGGATFVRQVIPTLAEQAPDIRDALLTAAERGGAQFDEYAEYLAAEVAPTAGGEFAIGRALFEERLRDWHMLDITTDELAATGRRLFEDTLAQLQELAAEIAPGRDWPDLVEEARADHPTADGLLDAYRDELARLRAFVEERELVTIPDGEQLEVVDTPPFERAVIPYAAYLAPAPFEADQRGQFWVTPIDRSAPSEQQIAQLQEHCWGSLPLTALHEGFPGHHLQLVRANAHPSFVRKHASSDLFAEGWAFYCEQLLGEHGYYRDWRLRLFQLKDQLWRSARVVIDPSLHTGTMTPDEAVTLLVEGAHLARAQAEGEVRRYCTTPTQPMTYAIGKEQILALRDELASLSPRAFHDRLLASGTLPFSLVRQEMLRG
ncbi:MAG: DUF885 domain-containing protein [Chloroflexi bacterium]|nr:DUF885 domain-containing protein [Chloroflexota bacterium]